MSRVTDESSAPQTSIVYLPHHCVIKESSESTKLRIIFDASSKTNSGISLNDLLHVGSTLQSNLNEIIMRFRCHNIALTGDLCKMYRQISLHPADREYQHILWRENTEEPVKQFRLNTVTYGETNSSYLAIKCIRRLAEQAGDKYVVAKRVILKEMWMTS